MIRKAVGLANELARWRYLLAIILIIAIFADSFLFKDIKDLIVLFLLLIFIAVILAFHADEKQLSFVALLILITCIPWLLLGFETIAEKWAMWSYFLLLFSIVKRLFFGVKASAS